MLKLTEEVDEDGQQDEEARRDDEPAEAEPLVDAITSGCGTHNVVSPAAIRLVCLLN